MAKSVKQQVLFALITFMALVFLFYMSINFSAIITPVLTCLLLSFILPNIDIKENIITKTISYLGEKSLYIYLYHVFIVWHFQYYAYKFILSIIDINHTLLFFVLLPLELIITLLVSKIVEVINKKIAI